MYFFVVWFLIKLNWLVFNIKYYIYSVKIIQKDMHMNAIKAILRKQFQVEKYIYFKNYQYDKLSKCWDKLVYLFS